MTAKKVYIAPEAEVFTVKQESPLMAGTQVENSDYTGGDLGGVEIGKWGQTAKENTFFQWDEIGEDRGSLWDE